MGKMKAYMMELQEEADYAISEGANSGLELCICVILECLTLMNTG